MVLGWCVGIREKWWALGQCVRVEERKGGKTASGLPTVGFKNPISCFI